MESLGLYEMLQIEERSGLHVFRHEAMATELTLSLGGVDEAYARGAAQVYFARVDDLEAKLSLYQETSDVTRINLLCEGAQTRVSEECIECLQLAMLVSEVTGGRFHPFLGAEALKVKGGVPAYLGRLIDVGGGFASSFLQIDPATRQVAKMLDGAVLDLGGIGKGFALDLGMEEIEDWEIPLALANFGGSTLLFRSVERGSVWKASLGGERVEPFASGAFSSSGVGFQGEHIVSVEGSPLLWDRSFARSESAAVADALSTGAMLMSSGELDSLCRCDSRFVVAAARGIDVWGSERFCSWGVS